MYGQSQANQNFGAQQPPDYPMGQPQVQSQSQQPPEQAQVPGTQYAGQQPSYPPPYQMGQQPYYPYMPPPQKPKNNWGAFWFGLLYMLIFVLSQLVVTFILAIIWAVGLIISGNEGAIQYLLDFNSDVMQNFVAVTLIVSSFVTVGTVWLIAKLRGFNPIEAAFMNPAKPIVLVASLIFGIAYSLAFNSFANLPVFDSVNTSSLMEAQAILYGSLLMALAGSILIPIVEELVFRGFALNELRRGVGIVAAFLITSIVFGLVHGHPLWALMAGFLGMVFAWFALRTRSVYPAIMAHIGVNAASFAFIELSKDVDSFSPIYIDFINTPTLLTIMTVGIVLLVATFIVIILKSEPASTIGPAPEPVKKTPTIATPIPLPINYSYCCNCQHSAICANYKQYRGEPR